MRAVRTLDIVRTLSGNTISRYTLSKICAMVFYANSDEIHHLKSLKIQ